MPTSQPVDAAGCFVQEEDRALESHGGWEGQIWGQIVLELILGQLLQGGSDHPRISSSRSSPLGDREEVGQPVLGQGQVPLLHVLVHGG